MRVRETKEEHGFGGNTTVWVRVVEVEDGEDPPKGSEPVADDEKLHDWDLETNRSEK